MHLENITEWSKQVLRNWGVAESFIGFANFIFMMTLVIIILIILELAIRMIVVNSFQKIANNSKTKFDDYIIQNKTFTYLTRLVLLIAFDAFLPALFADFQGWLPLTEKIVEIIMVLNLYFLFRAVLRTTRDYLSTKPSFQDKPLGSYTQVVNLVMVFILSIVLFTVVTDKDPWKFLTAFGAASAIVMLVFKDTILGFVASIQVSVNDMVRIGDWIEMPKYGADGDVIEINLNTVKVQNWDKTITTVPTHYLVTDSFKNWRGMFETGGRRIKRPILIKISSIRYLSSEEIQELQKIQLLAPFIAERQAEIDAYNQESGADRSMPVNGRNITNVGLFREYINRYIRSIPGIHKDMTMLVRQLTPTEHGLPIELYMFTKDTRWVYFENTMSDIFDHLFAAIKYFDLEVFEAPASDDVRNLSALLHHSAPGEPRQ
jgi:miniconductance mechanosensitive channel